MIKIVLDKCRPDDENVGITVIRNELKENYDLTKLEKILLALHAELILGYHNGYVRVPDSQTHIRLHTVLRDAGGKLDKPCWCGKK